MEVYTYNKQTGVYMGQNTEELAISRDLGYTTVSPPNTITDEEMLFQLFWNTQTNSWEVV